MGSTHAVLLNHIVFSVKNRTPCLKGDIRPRLFEYLGGAIRGQRGVALTIGGTTDHVHLLISWRPNESISNLMREIKTQSTRWIRDTFPALDGFRWQDGYAVFSVSPSARGKVAKYIEHQEEHHRRSDYQEELIALLRAHGVEFDERYL